MTGRVRRDTVASHECGWQSKRTTRELAEYALRRHSCDLQDRRNAAAARGAARRAAVDRAPKPCLHKVARHEHGTYACYVLDLCRCDPCSAANAAYEKRRAREHAYGRWHNYVDAEPTRQHVLKLKAAGIGLKQVAKVSGVSHGALWKLIYGKAGAAPSRRITYDTAIRIQTVHPTADALAGGAPVPAVGTRRRLQALVAVGWSQSKLARRLGMHISNFQALLERPCVQARTERAARALFDELWDTEPPHDTHYELIAYNRSIKMARDREWASPGAWLGIDIDDPAAHPNATGYDNDRVELVLAGALLDGDEDLELALTQTDRIEVARRGRVVHRWPICEIARQTGLPQQVLYADQNARPRKYAMGAELDEIAVERFMGGTLRLPGNARSAERVEAIRRLASRGMSDTEIADRVGLDFQAVLKQRVRNSIPAGVERPARRLAERTA